MLSHFAFAGWKCTKARLFSELLFCSFVGLRWGLTLLACACAFAGFLLSIRLCTGLPLRLFVTTLVNHKGAAKEEETRGRQLAFERAGALPVLYNPGGRLHLTYLTSNE